MERLRGLGEVEETGACRGEVSIQTDKVTEQDLALVKTFIQHFGRTKKIPGKLTELINFKKPMFDRQIAPALLTVELSSEEEETLRGTLARS